MSEEELHGRLNEAVSAVASMVSVLQAIADHSSEPEIRALAEQALKSPTLTSILFVESPMAASPKSPQDRD